MHPSLVLLAILPAPAQGRVWIVDEDLASGAHFADIQPAIDAAAAGDTILVRDGEYSTAVIDGKSLQLVGEAGGEAEDRRVGVITIRNLAAGEEAVVQGLYAYDTPLLVEACAGEVLLQDMVSADAPGARITGCSNVTISRCRFSGSGSGTSVQGDAGLIMSSSTVHAYDSTFVGGPGKGVSTCDGFAAQGGAGASIHGGLLVTSGTQFHGGSGGYQSASCPSCSGGRGGTGLEVEDGATVWSLAGEYKGGKGGFTWCPGIFGSDGSPMLVDSPASKFKEFSGAARSMVADRLVGPGEAIDFHLSGEPTDVVYLVYQFGQAPLFLPTLSGTLIPQWPAPVAFAGTLPGSGELDLAVPFAGLPPGLDSVPLVVQGDFVDPTTPTGYTGYLGTPLGILLRSCATTFGEPDCNANGRADDCDISAGLSLDLNENWIPDECESYPTWRVDDDGPGDPGPGNPLVSDPLEDGSALHPFDAIAEAVAAAGSFDTVLIADGLYTGVGNREIKLGTKSLVVRSEHGPAACVIDLQGAGQGFSGEEQVPWARIEGLTIRNGVAQGPMSTEYYGGGVRLEFSQATIADCVIEGCSAARGGGIFLGGFRGRVQRCRIQDNHASLGRGGGISAEHWGDSIPDFVVEDCVILGNASTASAPFGGGGGINADGTVRLERSLLVGNTSASDGGGARFNSIFGGLPGEVRSCLFAFNSAPAGGGAMIRTDLRIVGSTFTQNFAALRGGGILVQQAGEIEAESSILWGNASPLGPQVSLDDDEFLGAIHHCDVQGGEAAIEVVPGASFTYGPGNLDVDPVFVAPFHLHPASPCIDAGDPAFSPEPGETDLEGDPRVQGSAIDMGADEAG